MTKEENPSSLTHPPQSSASESGVSDEQGSIQPTILSTLLPTVLFDFSAFLLLGIAFWIGLASWEIPFSSPDRIVFGACVGVGLFVALARSQWQGDRTWSSVRLSRLACVLGSVFICVSVYQMNPIWSALACGLIFAGWCIVRIKGDTVFQGMLLGLMLVAPFAIDRIENLGWFEWMKSFTVNMTSLLANAIGESHAKEEWSILFSRGTADRFETVGVWDSLLSLLGAALFFVLALRRNCVPALLNILLCFFVWAAVRSVGWATLVLLASQNETWFPWSFQIEILLFCISVLLVFGLDLFFATVFEPIPFEYFNAESPIGAFMWNWVCGLPKFTLRVPKRNKISQRWRTLLHIAGKRPSFKTDFEWIRIELYDVLIHPLHAIGSTIDAVRGWKDSRKWIRFFSCSPAALLMILTYVTIAFYATRRTNSEVLFLVEESLKLCPTDLLEAAARQEQELDFRKAIQANGSEDEIVAPVADSTKRQVEILCKRILEEDAGNAMAKYRIALVYALNKDTQRATNEMTELTSGRFGEFPQADSWLAKSIIISNGQGNSISLPKLLAHLENARKWKNNDVRLLFFYARVLEERNETTKALFFAKQAVSIDPRLGLELAKIYDRLKDNDSKFKTAQEVADHFFAKLNTESEKEIDLLIVADAMLLSDKPEEAVKVLKEGLERKPESVAVRRQLCKIQLMFFEQSFVKKNEDGTSAVDLSLLEAAAETDPTDPRISSEIARLIPLGKSPSKQLMDVLRSQIEEEIASIASLQMLGEAFYARGKFEIAKKYWEQALARDPENFAVLNNLATCLVVMSTENADRAIEMVMKANSLSPNNPDILDTWGEILLVAKRPQEAINKFELSMRRQKEQHQPDRIETKKKLVSAYEATGMSDMVRILSENIKQLEEKQRLK